jgi:hypothetical protein
MIFSKPFSIKLLGTKGPVRSLVQRRLNCASDYRKIPLPITGASGAISGAATAGLATALFFALESLVFRGFFAAFFAFAFLAGARLAFFVLRFAAFLILAFFLDFFALRAMTLFPSTSVNAH